MFFYFYFYLKGNSKSTIIEYKFGLYVDNYFAITTQ